MKIEASQKLQKIVVGTLEQIQHSAEHYADSGAGAAGGVGRSSGSKRRLAAATTASLISASLDRVQELSTDEEDNLQGLSTEERKIVKQNHFIDILLEKLIQNTIPNNVPDKTNFYNRVNDPIRKNSDNLSITKFSSNLTKLTGKIGGIFQAQYFILKVFHWKDPSLTLTCLIIYTILISHPNLFIILPFIFLLYGVMIPGYLYRHPISNLSKNLIHIKERGDTLIEKFARIKDDKNLEEMLEDDQEQNFEMIPEIDDPIDKSTSLLKNQMEFLVNMRDLQNLMTNLLKLNDNFENFWYGTAGFKDERLSTSMFFNVFSLTIVLLILNPYINYKLIFISLGWLLLILIHPKILPTIKKFNELVIKPQNEKLNKIVKESERHDIIMDESPEIKQVEIFEIFIKNNKNQWDFYLYSTNIFDFNDEFRKSQNPPPGVSKLEEIGCPKTWRFQDSQWHIDFDCKTWVVNRSIQLNKMEVNEEFLIDEEFKRRRLYRNVIRYSKPARKPPHLNF